MQGGVKVGELTQEDLAHVLTDAKGKISIGATYRHYKDRLYTVIAVALNEETLEPCVIYQAKYGEKLTWIRPVSDWCKTIEWEGTLVQRFTPLVKE